MQVGCHYSATRGSWPSAYGNALRTGMFNITCPGLLLLRLLTLPDAELLWLDGHAISGVDVEVEESSNV